VAGALLTLRRGHGTSAGSREARADYKVTWVHGVAAAFGGDFFIVFYMTVILLPMVSASMDASFLSPLTRLVGLKCQG
jgi:hypothetical protein